MTLRWCLLSLLLSAATVSSLHMWRHRHKPAPVPVTESEPEDMVADMPPPRLAYRPPARPRPVHRPAATGKATVWGRVLGAQEPSEDRELSLVVIDESRELEVTVEADGHFAIELTPGTYRFHAQFGEMTATLEEVTVFAEEDKEVVLQLAEAVAIKGTLRIPDVAGDVQGDDGFVEISLRFEIRLSGESEWSDAEGTAIEDDEFTVPGLEVGKSYDLRLTSSAFRTVELTGISAPSHGLSVELDRLARLQGGFGIARGEQCPIKELTMSVDDEVVRVVVMDRFCRFDFGELPPVPRVRVQASEGEWSFDLLVDIPRHGDPPFLCLYSVCREPAPDELSTLEVSLAGSPDEAFFVSVYCDQEHFGTRSVTGEAARIAELPSGTEVVVTARAPSCRYISERLTLEPGVNRLYLTCEKR